MKVLVITEHILTELYCLKITILRKEATSVLAGFHVGLLSWSHWNLEMLVFIKGGKLENLERREKGENQQITQPTYIV